MERFILGTRGVRAGLLVLAFPQLAIGVWALVSPSGWYGTFPGAGKHWLPLYGSFDSHLATDVGSTFLALGVLLVLAAIWMDRRLVLAAAIAYLVYQVPHTIFHWANDSVLASGDQIANGIALGLSVFLGLGIVVAMVHRPSPKVPGTPANRRRFSRKAWAAARWPRRPLRPRVRQARVRPGAGADRCLPAHEGPAVRLWRVRGRDPSC